MPFLANWPTQAAPVGQWLETRHSFRPTAADRDDGKKRMTEVGVWKFTN